MEKLHDLNFILPLAIGLFWSIVFLQSSFDKLLDWKGNLSWLNDHFKNTPFKTIVPFLLGVLAIFELAAGLISFVGVVIYLIHGTEWWIQQGLILVMISFLMLIFGQRLAKDYEGAKTVAIYFGVALVSAFLLL